MLKKTIVNNYNGNSHNVEFKGSRKAHTAPDIVESFVDDDGNIIHILANGNTQSDASYMAVWGKPKGVIDWKSKGVNPNQRKLL